MTSEVDVEAWELFASEHGDDAEVSHITVREWIDLHRRLRAAEAERDKYARLHSEAEAQIECRNELRYRLRESEAALAQVRAQVDTMIATHDEVEKRAEQAERERSAAEDAATLQRDRAKQAERERDEARAEIDTLHTITLDVMRERDEARAAYQALDGAQRTVALGHLRRAEAAEARVAELEANALHYLDALGDAQEARDALRAIRDAAEAASTWFGGGEDPPLTEGDRVRTALRAALAAARGTT